MSDLHIETAHFLMRLMRPGDENATWQSWLANPQIMATVNARPAKRSMDELRQFLTVMALQQKAVIGIYEKPDNRLRGVLEAQFDQRQKSVSMSLLDDWQAREIEAALGECEAALLTYLHTRFGAAKFAMVLPATSQRIALALQKAGWQCEGTLRAEFPSATGHGRIDAWAYGKCLSL
jgi:hypothetical protein